MKVDIGISEVERKAIAGELGKLLADSYTLYLKTHNFHWNITGHLFQTLHLMFEGQYLELARAVDLIAERIRALGLPAPATYSEFQRLTVIKEPNGVPSARDMIHQLVEGHEAISRSARSAFSAVEKAHDAVSADLLTQRMQIHEKSAWMLRSMLEG